MYDQVWLFGISTFYPRGPGYLADRLSDAELRAISEFMDGGGGLFATGDTSPDSDVNEVSMTGERRKTQTA